MKLCVASSFRRCPQIVYWNMQNQCQSTLHTRTHRHAHNRTIFWYLLFVVVFLFQKLAFAYSQYQAANLRVVSQQAVSAVITSTRHTHLQSFPFRRHKTRFRFGARRHRMHLPSTQHTHNILIYVHSGVGGCVHWLGVVDLGRQFIRIKRRWIALRRETWDKTNHTSEHNTLVVAWLESNPIRVPTTQHLHKTRHQHHHHHHHHHRYVPLTFCIQFVTHRAPIGRIIATWQESIQSICFFWLQ